MGSERKIGHIAGVVPGAVLHRRIDVQRAKLHGDMQRGISKLRDVDGKLVGDAIVLNGGYVDDEDEWTSIRYTGASPDKDRDPVTKALLRDQDWAYDDNAALKLSYERKHQVRIIRGYNGDRRFSLHDNYRYDGLYEISEIRTAVSKTPAPDGRGIKICQFDLKRLPDAKQELTALEQQVAEILSFDEPEKFPETSTTQVQRLVRDTAAARRIKDLYGGQCQVCETRVIGPDDVVHGEGAHVKPLGRPHGGPDVERNILCLCPNCHVRLDIGAISVADDQTIIDRVQDESLGAEPRKLMSRKGHEVHLDYIRYQREWWDAKLNPNRP
ncbi:YDG/SRA domain-containing protein [Streptomyces sp. 21So2-11]|uniref:YDG/SRA domain-containing protein n=1 Tax=Streptomyces sp. 21So2-11 TaxID=3144408 RepID=UPI00321A3247